MLIVIHRGDREVLHTNLSIVEGTGRGYILIDPSSGGRTGRCHISIDRLIGPIGLVYICAGFQVKRAATFF